MGVLRRRLRLAFLLLVLVATMAAPSLANGAPHVRGSRSLEATLTVTPAEPTAGGNSYTITGSGFTPDSWVGVSISNPGCCISYSKWADSSGNLLLTSSTGSPGTYVVKAYQRNGKRTVLKAEITFQVGS